MHNKVHENYMLKNEIIFGTEIKLILLESFEPSFVISNKLQKFF